MIGILFFSTNVRHEIYRVLLLLYLIFALLCSSLLLLFFPTDLLSQKCRVKTNSFNLFFPSRFLYKNTFQVFIFVYRHMF